MAETEKQKVKEKEKVPAVGKEQLRAARETLSRYRAAKSATDARAAGNERWYNDRLRGRSDGGQWTARSAWLYNCIENKLADMMDNFPSPNILPREENDRDEARSLSSIVPVILDGCDFEETYRKVCLSKLRTGTGVYGVFWDPRKQGGLGGVDVRQVDVSNFFAEPGVNDLQASHDVFTVEYVDIEQLEMEYPDVKREDLASVGGCGEGKSEVVSWYYKKRQGTRTVLHFCRFAGDAVLYATENMTEPVRNAAGEAIAPPPAMTGLYDHGLYPFVVDSFIDCGEGLWGCGLIDIGRNAQEWIDRGGEAMLKSMRVNAGPRFFVRANAEVNREEFADLTSDIVTFTGSDPSSSVMPIVSQPVSGVYLSILDAKIGELKETTGNRDVSTGGTVSGVTAASAIAAMQEAAGKTSREINKQSYRAYRKIVLFIIELIRQFYTAPRCFRITGRRVGGAAGLPSGAADRDAEGGMSFLRYDNRGLCPGGGGGYRLPQMDVEVTAQKKSPYSKMSQNEFALQLYNAGFFAPERREAALMALEMMDFERKEFVMDLIARADGGGLPTGALPGRQSVLTGETEKGFMISARKKAVEASSPR